MFTVNVCISIGIYLPVSAVSSCTTLLCFFLRLVAWNKHNSFQWTIYHLRLPKNQLEVCKFLCDVWLKNCANGRDVRVTFSIFYH